MFSFHAVLLTAHILAALLTVGWLLTDALLLPPVIRSGNLPVLQWAGGHAGKIGPASSVVFLLGLWLVAYNKGIGFGDKWVGMAMTLFILATVNGAVFIGGTARKAGMKIAQGQPATAEANRVTLLGLLNLVFLILIVYLMVAKPT